MSSKANSQEEDVDDLDDIAEQFDANPHNSDHAKVPPQTAASASSSSSSSSAAGRSALTSGPHQDAATAEKLPEELAKQLAEDMEHLMRELSEGTYIPASEDERKRKEAWERMLIDGMNGVGADELKDGSMASMPSQQSQEDVFQASILQAMEKLKSSDSTLHTDASSAAAASDDPFEAILSQLGSGVEDSGEDNQELQDMLETMMQQLMSKDVLYEPLKELHEKFPYYLSENDSKLSLDDKLRFQSQMSRVSKIVEIFEDPSYKEGDQQKGATIVTLMNEMQSFGSPPSEIMGPLPPGLDFGSDDATRLPERCTTF